MRHVLQGVMQHHEVEFTRHLVQPALPDEWRQVGQDVSRQERIDAENVREARFSQIAYQLAAPTPDVHDAIVRPDPEPSKPSAGAMDRILRKARQRAECRGYAKFEASHASRSGAVGVENE